MPPACHCALIMLKARRIWHHPCFSFIHGRLAPSFPCPFAWQPAFAELDGRIIHTLGILPSPFLACPARWNIRCAPSLAVLQAARIILRYSLYPMQPLMPHKLPSLRVLARQCYVPPAADWCTRDGCGVVAEHYMSCHGMGSTATGLACHQPARQEAALPGRTMN